MPAPVTPMSTVPPITAAPAPPAIANWKALRLLNSYRLVLATLLFLAGFPYHAVALGGTAPLLYRYVTLLYLAFGLLSIIPMDRRRPPFMVQVYAHAVADIAALTLLIYASGGLRSGVGVLLVVAVAGASLLMAGRIALLFAAIATLGLLAEQGYSELSGTDAANFTHAGLLGTAMFLTATLAYILAHRVRESEALAARRGMDLANLEQLTRYIVERMQTGIVVVDDADTMRLINDSARALLGITQGLAAAALPSALLGQLEQWRMQTNHEPVPLQATPLSPEVMPRFARLGVDKDSGTLIFLEDMTAMAQQAQQLKLASLGRLTASIAHEIRNPLSAISYAGQLFNESPHAQPTDKRLIEIICDQSRRVNTIVENVLQLSRRKRSQPEELVLQPWLAAFVDEFTQTQAIAADRVAVHVEPLELLVRIDPDQLHQVLWNLCHNGLRYSRPPAGAPALELRAGLTAPGQTPFLDVIDFGPGIQSEVAAHIFEPFFTTAQKGTGLGLYIARELCEANQARLTYVAAAGGGSCFRISFPDPRRRQVA